MTICYPQIITAQLCPRDELTFSLTPPNCVRVVPVYNDASYVISQFPPPVHFLVRDNGQVYQLADIQSPPSTPPEYHAVLDSTGCILIGVELSSVTTSPITQLQIRLIPGVLRHVLQTLGLPLTSVTNALPPQRCRPQLWQQILADTTDCLNTPPPPPPPPPGVNCSFVISCLDEGQNIDISTGGTISAGQLIPGPLNDQYTWVSPLGVPQFTLTTSTSGFTVQDTTTVDLTLSGGVLSANVNVSSQFGNQLVVAVDGLYVPPFALFVQDTQTVDLTLAGNLLSADVIISQQPGNILQALVDGLYVPGSSISVQNTTTVNLNLVGSVLSANVNVSGAPNNAIAINPDGLFVPNFSSPCLNTPPNFAGFPTNNFLASVNNQNCIEQLLVNAEHVIYGNALGAGTPQIGGLLYSPPPTNFLRADSGSSYTPLNNSLLITNASSVNLPNSANSLIAANFSSFTASASNSVLAVSGSSLSGNLSLSQITGIGSNIFSGARGSVVTVDGSSLGTTTRSAILAENSSFFNTDGSFISASFGGFQSTASSVITATNSNFGNIVYSGYLARQSNPLSGNPTLEFCLVTSNLTQFANAPYQFSTIHSDVSIFTGDNLINYSFVTALQCRIGGAISSLFMGQANFNQQPNLFHSVFANGTFDTNPARVGPPAPIINTSLILSFSRSQPNAWGSVYVNGGLNLVDSINASVVVGGGFNFADPNPPNNVVNINNSLIVGSFHDISNLANINGLTLSGQNLAAGAVTVFGVGYGAYTTPAIQSVGGWLAYIADSGGSAGQNYFQGWDSAWRFRPHSVSTNYANDAAAAAALNLVYGIDPRISIGTMVVVRVNNTPAIFTWNGTAFVRITV